MEIIRDLVQTLIIIVVLAVFLDMLLPTGQMKPYVKMVMGLLIIIAVLHSISGLLQQDWMREVPGVTARPGSPGPPLEDIMAAGEQLQLKNQDMALEKYRQGLSRQVLSMAKLSPGAKVVDVEISLEEEQSRQSYGGIKHITLLVDPNAPDAGNNTRDNIRPVNINVSDSHAARESSEDMEIPPELEEEIEKVTGYIAGFYNLSPEQVSVIYKTP
jgi:stage III sporulation protein AF